MSLGGPSVWSTWSMVMPGCTCVIRFTPTSSAPATRSTGLAVARMPAIVALTIQTGQLRMRPSLHSLVDEDVRHDAGDARRLQRHLAGRLDLPLALRLAHDERRPVHDTVLEAL